MNHICASWEDKIHLEGDGFPKGYIENCINNGDLPPIKSAHISNYYLMVIQKTDGKIIGFFDLYHGYPNNETVWISIFLIEKEVQGNSYGQEAINSICDECKKIRMEINRAWCPLKELEGASLFGTIMVLIK